MRVRHLECHAISRKHTRGVADVPHQQIFTRSHWPCRQVRWRLSTSSGGLGCRKVIRVSAAARSRAAHHLRGGSKPLDLVASRGERRQVADHDEYSRCPTVLRGHARAQRFTDLVVRHQTACHHRLLHVCEIGWVPLCLTACLCLPPTQSLPSGHVPNPVPVLLDRCMQPHLQILRTARSSMAIVHRKESPVLLLLALSGCH